MSPARAAPIAWMRPLVAAPQSSPAASSVAYAAFPIAWARSPSPACASASARVNWASPSAFDDCAEAAPLGHALRQREVRAEGAEPAGHRRVGCLLGVLERRPEIVVLQLQPAL